MGANTAYIYSTGGDFVIGNGTASKNMRFFSTDALNNTTEKFRLNSFGVTMQMPIKTITDSYTLTIDDYTILCNNSVDITVTLPPASSAPGRTYVIKKIGNNTKSITIATNGSELIDNATSLSIATRYVSQILQNDGTGWWIINKQ